MAKKYAPPFLAGLDCSNCSFEVLSVQLKFEGLIVQPRFFCYQVQSGMTASDNIREQGGRTKVFKMVFQYFFIFNIFFLVQPSSLNIFYSDHNSGGGGSSLSENRPIHWGGLPHQLLYPSSVCLLAKSEIEKHIKMISWQQYC